MLINRFIILRCPSLSFAESEDVNETLVKEDRHILRLNEGRMVMRSEIEIEIDALFVLAMMFYRK